MITFNRYLVSDVNYSHLKLAISVNVSVLIGHCSQIPAAEVAQMISLYPGHLEMFTLVSLSFLINTVILVFGSGVDHKHVAVQQHTVHSASSKVVSLINGIKVEIRNLDRELEELSSRNDNLQRAISKVKTECVREVQEIQEQQKPLIKSTGRNVELLKQQALSIHKEEEENDRLEAEYKSYSVLADLWMLKHDVVLGDLQLMSGRRQNGTSERCKNLTVQVDAEEAHRSQTRSAYWRQVMVYRKKQRVSTETFQFKAQQLELSRREGEKRSMLRTLEDAQKALQDEQDQCAKAKRSDQQLLKTIKEMLATSVNSKTLLNADLLLAQSINRELRTKIQFVKLTITKWRQKVIDLKRDFAGYRDDMKCYIKVERYS